jgi:beta-galactosidase
MSALSTGRSVRSLNQGWHFKRIETADEATELPSPLGGHGWEHVTLPHTVRLEPLNASGCRNFQGVCWYTRTFTLSTSDAGRTIYLHVDGAMQVCDVWLNGKKIHTNYGGYIPFVLDLTPHVCAGETFTLAMRLDNRDAPDVPPGKPQNQLDFTYFGGLYRNVWLESVNPLHVSDPIHANRVAGGGVRVQIVDANNEHATVQVQVDLRNADRSTHDASVRFELLDLQGNLVAEASADVRTPANNLGRVTKTLDVDRPQLWHPDHPHLYRLRVSILENGNVVDSTDTTVGLRRIDWDVNRGLLINGAKFFTFGANRHQDHPHLGYALSDAAQWREAQKLKDAGFTSFRSHYPQSTAFMNACDALGILAIVSNPGWQYCGGELFQQRALHNARLMVRRDRNHPSVILWEAALNESDNRALAAALHNAVHEEQPGDQCFTAGDRNAHFVGPEGEKQPPSVWDIDYLHNDGTKPHFVREWGDRVDNWSDQQSANRVSRAWGEGPMLTQALSHIQQMDMVLQGHHGTHTGDRLAGACLWAGVDCQRGYHHQPFYGGVLDGYRLPKFNYYLFQSQRSPKHGPMVFVANFASFISPTTVTVFSNCDQVRLSFNGQEVATRSPDAGHYMPHPPFTFRVEQFATEHSTMFMNPAAEGAVGTPPELKAEGLIDGKVVATHIVRPPGQPKRLRLSHDLAGQDLRADGADFVRVHATVCDARGTPCQWADDSVLFRLTGPATIVEGDGLQFNPATAAVGVATVLVRAVNSSGLIQVRAEAFGLEPAEIELHSVQPKIEFV